MTAFSSLSNDDESQVSWVVEKTVCGAGGAVPTTRPKANPALRASTGLTWPKIKQGIRFYQTILAVHRCLPMGD